jgi:hypothetical protein
METENKRDKQGQLFTGLERSGPGWLIYLRGRYVGEARYFSQAEDRLNKLQHPAPQEPEAVKVIATPKAADRMPAVVTHDMAEDMAKEAESARMERKPEAPTIPPDEARLIPEGDAVLLITTGRKSFAGSYVTEDERVEALIHNGERRPPRRPVSVTQAINELIAVGYTLETVDAGLRGRIGKWHKLQTPAGSILTERRAARFTREARV